MGLQQARALQDAGHIVTVIAPGEGYGAVRSLRIEGVAVLLFPMTRIPTLGFAGLFSPRLLVWIRKHAREIDVLHVHLARDLVTLPAATLSRLLTIPLVVQTHGMIDPSRHPLARPMDALMTRPALLSASAVFHLNDVERADLLCVAPRLRNLTHLPNGISPNLAERPYRDTSGQEVLFLSRLHRRKRPMEFAKAGVELSSDYPDATFTLVGPDEGESEAIQALLREHPAARVALEGPVEPTKARQRTAMADIFVLPSTNEPFGMAALEAMSAGVPVIVTESCGLAGTVRDHNAGLVISDAPDALAPAIRYLLDNPDKRDLMGAQAREVADGLFGLDRIVEVLEREYGQAAALPGRAPAMRTPRVLWLTNVASPYRRPLWAALSTKTDLRVALLQNNRMLSRQGRRGKDWESRGSSSITVESVSAAEVPYGENPLYILVRGLRLLRQRPDAILLGGWESPAYLQTLLMAKVLRIRTVGFYESTLETNGHKTGPIAAARRLFFRSLDAVVVPGAAAREAIESFGVSRVRVFEGFNAVDVDFFHSEAQAHHSHERSAAEGHRFIYVGQLIERKNVGVLLGAFAAMRAKTDRLTIVGTGVLSDGLRRQVKELSLQDAVDFIPSLLNSEMPSLLAGQHTLVLPSHEEVWGLVVNEALAAGLNVVVSENCGVSRSVGTMQGVFMTTTHEVDVATAMANSRAEWRGPRSNPEILAYTPERFAGVFFSALSKTA